METQPNLSQRNSLQALLRAVPKAPLSLGEVGNGSPGILAGSQPICRLKNDDLGGAYGELIVATVNALPDLLDMHPATDRSTPTSRVDHGLRELMLERISAVLSMRPGAAKSSPIWSKLILTSLETVVETMTGAPDPVSAIKHNGTSRIVGSFEAQLQLEAVLSFAAYMLSSAAGVVIDESQANDLVGQWAAANGIKI